jgi:hypothetical protein
VYIPGAREARHSIGVGNGLDALMLALAATGIGPGDVDRPAAAVVATWLGSRVGATAVVGCCGDATFTHRPYDPPRALVPVRLHGHPADVDNRRAAR